MTVKLLTVEKKTAHVITVAKIVALFFIFNWFSPSLITSIVSLYFDDQKTEGQNDH
jgi:hypothetical protein